MDELQGLASILEKGGLTAALAISLFVNYMFYKELRTGEKERRIETKADSDKAWAALTAAATAGHVQADAMRQLKEIIDTAILRGGQK